MTMDDPHFYNYMLDNWCFNPDYTPVKNLPPKFLTQDGTFDAKAHTKWEEDIKKKYLTSS